MNALWEKACLTLPYWTKGIQWLSNKLGSVEATDQIMLKCGIFAYYYMYIYMIYMNIYMNMNIWYMLYEFYIAMNCVHNFYDLRLTFKKGLNLWQPKLSASFKESVAALFLSVNVTFLTWKS